jgi:hypothetical protein
MKKSVALMLTALLGVVGLFAVAPTANADTYKGNWELFLGNATCSGIDRAQSWCGTAFVVHADMLLSADDLVLGRLRLIGPNGDLPIQDQGLALPISRIPPQKIDPTYLGLSFEGRAASGQLVPGNYGLILTADTFGRWSCSIYSKSICNWLEPKKILMTWLFEWTGEDQVVQPLNVVSNLRTDTAGSGAKPRVVVTAAVSPARAGAEVTIQKRVKGKWVVLATKTSRDLGLAQYVDRSVKKGTTATYRVFAVNSPTINLKVTQKVR